MTGSCPFASSSGVSEGRGSSATVSGGDLLPYSHHRGANRAQGCVAKGVQVPKDLAHSRSAHFHLSSAVTLREHLSLVVWGKKTDVSPSLDLTLPGPRSEKRSNFKPCPSRKEQSLKSPGDFQAG